MIDVMSFGGGIQSTAIMTLAGEGVIPMPARWVFSDPGFESEATYAHLERCKEYIAAKGGRLDIVTAGNIRAISMAFAKGRGSEGVKRYASIPMFTLKQDGKQGILPRQCTKEYKLEPIERFHRAEVLGLRPRQHAPKTPTVCVWIGISADEERRATPPGRWRELMVKTGESLFGDILEVAKREWEPCAWQTKAFPLLGCTILPDRTKQRDERFSECDGWDRDDAKHWLSKSWPHPVPRSACICCPYRTNSEWQEMKDTAPAEFAQAVEFDKAVRVGYAVQDVKRKRGDMTSIPFLHRSMIPLDMVDLSAPLNDRKGCGGLFSQEPDGICGV